MNTESSGESLETEVPSQRGALARWILRLIWVLILIAILAIGLLAGSFVRFSRDVIQLQPPAGTLKADAIVVFTGGSLRIDQGVKLLDEGVAERLLISGVNPATTGRQLQRLTSAEPALFECCVDIGHDAIDTIGNANEAAQWIIRHGYESIIVVTSNYHMPRSLLQLRRVDRSSTFIPYPVISSSLQHLRWLQQPDALRMLFAEYIKYVAARFRLTRSNAPPNGLRSSSIDLDMAQSAGN